jgi:hypothetical protein
MTYFDKVTNGFAALVDFDTELDNNSVWEIVRVNVNISVNNSVGYFEMGGHKPWFDEGCSELVDQRKQAKL